jgi:hypothetical protein
MQCLKANILFLWIGNNDVLGFATTVMEQIHYTSAGVAGVGLMRHMICW